MAKARWKMKLGRVTEETVETGAYQDYCGRMGSAGYREERFEGHHMTCLEASRLGSVDNRHGERKSRLCSSAMESRLGPPNCEGYREVAIEEHWDELDSARCCFERRGSRVVERPWGSGSCSLPYCRVALQQRQET